MKLPSTERIAPHTGQSCAFKYQAFNYINLTVFSIITQTYTYIYMPKFIQILTARKMRIQRHALIKGLHKKHAVLLSHHAGAFLTFDPAHVPLSSHQFRIYTLSVCVRRKSVCASTPFPRILSWPLSKVALPDQSHSAQLRHLIRHTSLAPPLLDLSLRLHSKPSMSGTDAPNHCRICFLISSGVASPSCAE